jgi:nucleoside phosphorylase
MRKVKKTESPGDATERTQLYLSHSYRGRDRRVNEFFWELFWDAGFTFSVDPQSKVLSVPYLEYMMKGSAGYAAVVTLRPEQKYYLCSPYVLYEYGLARLAQKPRLIFVEQDVSDRYFAESGESLQVYDPSDSGLKADRQLFVELIDKFAERVRPYRRSGLTLRGKAGILIHPGRPAYDVLKRIEDVVDKAGFRPERVPFEEPEDLNVLIRFDSYDFVVVDLDTPGIPSWMYPFIHGRFIPSIRLLHVSGDSAPELPPLVKSTMLRGLAPVDEPVLYWRDADLLVDAIEAQIARVKRNRQNFESFDDGLRYFRKAERREASIFISNAGEANDFAGRLAVAMKADGMEVFQYQEANRIPIGEEWEPWLQNEVRHSEIFLPLVTKGFWKSKPCMMEYDLAKRSGAIVIPCFLERAPWKDMNTQGIPLPPRSNDETRIEIIVSETDKLLRANNPRPRPKDALPVDIAFVTVLPQEYKAVLRLLKDPRSAPLSEDQPNDWAWHLGEIESPTYGRYRAVLAFAGQAGTTNAVNVTRDTVERWRPRYILLVGIAGGMPVDGLEKGDIVVSKLIWEYEYGKIDSGFEPRLDLMYPCDGRLVRSAEILPTLQPEWSSIVRQPCPSGAAHQPKVRVGIVGSGNKVIDHLGDRFFKQVRAKVPGLKAVEMEGAGAAAAVLAMRGRYGGEFVMIRGVSDMPPSRSAAKIKGAASAQTVERDAWKAFASDAAASFAVQLVSLAWPTPPRS